MGGSENVTLVANLTAPRGADGVEAILQYSLDVALTPYQPLFLLLLIVAGAALKGPADRMLVELGHEPTVVGVARMYAPICSTLIIDSQDEHLVTAVEREGMRCIATDTIMSKPGVAASLARITVGATPHKGGQSWHD
jgi:hypothetical protein